jgi:tripartite-type tricarboxylate transporter receptor subunit TctC
LSGEVKMTLTAPSAQMFEMAKSGKVRLLGVSTRGPSQLVQGIPSIADVIPGFESQYWFGFVAPARTSDAAVQKLHDAIDKILADPAVIRQILAMGNEVGSGTSAEFQKLIDSEWLRWRAVVKSAKIAATN